MSDHTTTDQAHNNQLDQTLSFEVAEVVSLLARFERQTLEAATSRDDDYDPFAPEFPITH